MTETWADSARVIAIRLVPDRKWSPHIPGDLIAIKCWSRQALLTYFTEVTLGYAVSPHSKLASCPSYHPTITAMLIICIMRTSYPAGRLKHLEVKRISSDLSFNDRQRMTSCHGDDQRTVTVQVHHGFHFLLETRNMDNKLETVDG